MGWKPIICSPPWNYYGGVFRSECLSLPPSFESPDAVIISQTSTNTWWSHLPGTEAGNKAIKWLAFVSCFTFCSLTMGDGHSRKNHTNRQPGASTRHCRNAYPLRMYSPCRVGTMPGFVLLGSLAAGRGLSRWMCDSCQEAFKTVRAQTGPRRFPWGSKCRWRRQGGSRVTGAERGAGGRFLRPQ